MFLSFSSILLLIDCIDCIDGTMDDTIEIVLLRTVESAGGSVELAKMMHSGNVT